MIESFKEIDSLFHELAKFMTHKTHVFMIGGAALMEQGLKPATKDIDLIVMTRFEFETFENGMKYAGFEGKLPGIGYKNMDLSQIFIRDDFRIDIFCKTVCRGFSLSKEMIKRARLIIKSNKLSVSICSNEDIFLFKSLTEREGDIEDCIAMSKEGIDYIAILTELKFQIRQSNKPVWITWIAERFDILEQKGLEIPIKKEIDNAKTKKQHLH